LTEEQHVMDLHAVRYGVADRIATVTLDRPHRLNAWTGRMHTEYRWCLAEAERDPGVRVVVVTGAGRGFCAGADFAALERNVEAGGYDDGVREPLAEPGYGVRPEFDHAFAFHYGMATPVIAAINGPAAGVGLVLACFCDLRFAAAGAKLTTSAPRLGLPAEYGLSWVLPRLVGLGHAVDLLLSSRVVLAEEAAVMGLVNRVLPGDELLPATYAYARALADEMSPTSLRETKRQIYADQHGDVGTAVERSVALTDQLMGGADYAEGVAAWLARRPPQFPDPAPP
jgi:enoyl-CoA hydratase/carnithine racemase